VEAGMSEPRQAHLVLIQQMAESLTALGIYVGMTSSLLHSKAPKSRNRLIEVAEKSDAEVKKAFEILGKMRVLLH
jgi:hypothetical protein